MAASSAATRKRRVNRLKKAVLAARAATGGKAASLWMSITGVRLTSGIGPDEIGMHADEPPSLATATVPTLSADGITLTFGPEKIDLADDQEGALQLLLHLLAQGKEIVTLAGPAGTGKCVAGDTLVTTPAGVRRIDQCAATQEVATYTTEGGLAAHVGAATWVNNGIKPMLRVTLQTGARIDVTENHPLLVLTPEAELAWRRADALEANDVLLLHPGHAAEVGTPRVDPDEAYLLGLLMGDGSIDSKRHHLSWARDGDDLPPVFIELGKRFWGAQHTFGRVAQRDKAKGCTWNVGEPLAGRPREPAAAVRRLHELGFDLPTAPHKRIPDWLMGATAAERSAFLQGYFDTDGSASGGRQIEIVSASETLARQTQQMLLGLGVVSTLLPKVVEIQRGAHTYWRNFIQGADARTFADVVGFRHESRKRADLADLIDRPTNPNKGVWPHLNVRLQRLREAWWKPRGDWAKTGPISQGCKTTHYFARQDATWHRDISTPRLLRLLADVDHPEATFLRSLTAFSPTRVVGVEAIPDAPTFCFDVPGTKSFCANGIVSHNTTIMRVLLRRLRALGRDVVLVAPTNRAALRLQELTGVCAGTIHRLARMVPIVDDETGELLGFAEGEEGSAEIALGAVVIVDEASMVNKALREKLQRALPGGTQIVAVGDPCQLPPVHGEAGFDLQHPDALLTVVHRQEEGGHLLQFATWIRRHQHVLRGATVTAANGNITEATYEDLGIAIAQGAVPIVLVATNAARAQVNLAARKALGFPDLVMGPQVGERVIAYSTTRSDNPVANGEIGTVKVVREGTKTVGGEHVWWMVVDFGGVEHKLLVPSASWEGKGARKLGDTKAVTMPVSRAGAHAKPADQMRLIALQPAYGITVHKAQGSEWAGGCIILDVPSWLGLDTWRWGYTAVTRLRDWVQFIRITGMKRVAINRPPADMSQVRMVGQ